MLAHARVSAELAIGELIWNALDADAKEVSVALERNVPGGPVTRLTVTDDGHGLGPHEIDDAFASHRKSAKRERRISPGGRPMHGRNGRGRFRSFAVAVRARWRTWGEDELGQVAITEVTIRSD
ncbi:MAG: ATP-binding protein [Acidimicrobiales bacterium]|nr:ATP-binding protein [Acidimicrobiales bacterium]